MIRRGLLRCVRCDSMTCELQGERCVAGPEPHVCRLGTSAIAMPNGRGESAYPIPVLRRRSARICSDESAGIGSRRANTIDFATGWMSVSVLSTSGRPTRPWPKRRHVGRRRVHVIARRFPITGWRDSPEPACNRNGIRDTVGDGRPSTARYIANTLPAVAGVTACVLFVSDTRMPGCISDNRCRCNGIECRRWCRGRSPVGRACALSR